MFIKGLINKQRNKFLLPPIKDVWAHWLGEEVIVACDPELNKAHNGVSFPFIQTGFLLLESQQQLPDYVANFCNAGKPPVYIGFGSNPIADKEKFLHIFDKVSKDTNQRLIISKGWADLPEINSADILYVDDMPFDLLFPRLAGAVYHGGTGTMASIARAGIPQAAFPFMADQFSNRDNIVKLQLGPRTSNFVKMTAESITTAIIECLTKDVFKKNAVELSEKLKKSNGVELTINQIEKIILK
jgi:vancomycin aglycone glucosyltransferase